MSQKKEKNDVTYVQFDSIQKLRSAYASVFHSSLSFTHQHSVMKGEKGRMLEITIMHTDSEKHGPVGQKVFQLK